LGLGVQGSGFGVQSLWARAQGLGFRVQGFEFGVPRAGDRPRLLRRRTRPPPSSEVGMCPPGDATPRGVCFPPERVRIVGVLAGGSGGVADVNPAGEGGSRYRVTSRIRKHFLVGPYSKGIYDGPGGGGVLSHERGTPAGLL